MTADLRRGMRVLVCGDREWADREYLFATLDAFHAANEIVVVIEGEARGADRMAAQWAMERAIPYLPYPANWSTYGKSAGPIRNRKMLLDGAPDAVIAFHRDLANSKGTKDMVNVARDAGLPVHVFPSEDRPR